MPLKPVETARIMHARRSFLVGLTVAVLLLSTGALMAETVAITLPSELDGANSFNAEVGWVFETTAAIRITSVGVWDDGSIESGGKRMYFRLWDDESQTFLEQHLLDATNSTLEGPTTTIFPGRDYEEEGQFRFRQLDTPIQLEADHRYVVTGSWPGNPYSWTYTHISPTNVAAGIIYPNEGRWNWSGYPSRVHGPGWFGANFKCEVVPIPPAGLIGALGLGVLALVRRRGRRTR
jgi:hypothetical protein